MKLKSDAFTHFKLFKASFELAKSVKIMSLCSENGGEYISPLFSQFLGSNSMRQNSGPLHSPQLVGTAERANRTLQNPTRCAPLSSTMPKSFWVDSMRYICHPINSIPCRTPSGFKIPNSLLSLPSVVPHILHTFGCLVWFKIPEADRLKLDPKVRRAALLSYLPDGNSYRLWDLSQKRVVKIRDVIFMENVFPYPERKGQKSVTSVEGEILWPVGSGKPPALPPQRSSIRNRWLSESIHNPAWRPLSPSSFAGLPSPLLNPASIQSNIMASSKTHLPMPPHLSPPPAPRTCPQRSSSSPPVRHSGSTSKAPEWLGNWSKYAVISPNFDTPKTWKQLLQSPNQARWLKVADSEFSSLIGMNSWKLVPRPSK